MDTRIRYTTTSLLLAVVILLAPAFTQAENVVDATPPVISAIQETGVTSTSATITWSTNEATVSTFEFGTTQSYGARPYLPTSTSLTGKVLLNGLSFGTRYFYCIHATNASGNTADSCGHSFTTLSNTQLYNDGSTDPVPVRQQRIRGYRQQSGDLQNKISALGSVPVQSVIMPVLFGVGIKDIYPNFGDPRSGGRTHEGEDIMAVKGTPIVSPTDAIVLRAGDNGGTEGIYVYTANPGGETFVYYHLDKVGEGVVPGLVLKPGMLVGYVGNTGNAAGGPAHLHFEIHSSSGTPVDPFPRLTGEFSIAEKITYLATILGQTSDSTALAQLLVANFRGTFTMALAANIALPLPIVDAMALLPVTPVSAAKNLPAGDLDLGSSGAAVVALQKYLIQADSDGAAARLASAGATGYFGLITKAALVEFQVAVGISPASGYYGATTRTFVLAHPLDATATPAPANPPVISTAITRNLYLGLVGEDVRTLQKLLNANGYTVSLTGGGSPGNETTFFGSGTQAAVIKFQIGHAITPAVGYVGPITRAVLGSL